MLTGSESSTARPLLQQVEAVQGLTLPSLPLPSGFGMNLQAGDLSSLPQRRKGPSERQPSPALPGPGVEMKSWRVKAALARPGKRGCADPSQGLSSRSEIRYLKMKLSWKIWAV